MTDYEPPWPRSNPSWTVPLPKVKRFEVIAAAGSDEASRLFVHYQKGEPFDYRGMLVMVEDASQRLHPAGSNAVFSLIEVIRPL